MTHRFAADYRAMARDALRGKWGVAILVSFVVTLFCDDASFASFNSDSSDSPWRRFLTPDMEMFLLSLGAAIIIIAIFAMIVSLFITGVLSLGSATFHLRLVDGEEVAFRDLFSPVDRLVPAFKLAFLQHLYIYLWSLLFVIPGIVKTYSYAFSEYLMVEHPNWSASECITESRELMNGHKWRLFCLDFSFIGWELLYLLPAGILGAIALENFGGGALFLLLISAGISIAGETLLRPYRSAARAAFYRDVTDTRPRPQPFVPEDSMPNGAAPWMENDLRSDNSF